MNNNETLGEVFMNGRIVNLDNTSISDLERYISELEKLKEDADMRFNKIADEIKNM
jgi:hypothetical protein